MAAKMSHRTDPIQPATTIINLNDHVLRKVFENLDDESLNAAVDVCSNFKGNARAVFSARYKEKCFSAQMAKNTFPNDFLRLQTTLRNFSPFIHSLETGFFDIMSYCHAYPVTESRQVLELIAQHCAKTLNELQLYFIVFAADTTRALQTLLPRIRTIRLECCIYDQGFDACTMLSQCDELQKLSFRVIEKEMETPLIRVTIPKLKSLAIHDTDGVQNESIEKILELNPQLKEFGISFCKKVTGRIFQSIARYTPRIEKFEFIQCGGGDFAEHADYLKRLTALEWLFLDCQLNSLSPVISALAASDVPLKVLKLWQCPPDKELFNGISKLKQLKTLHMYGAKHMELTNILDMVGCLSELSDLHLSYHNQKTTANYLPIIQRAPKLQCLELGSDAILPQTPIKVELFKQIVDVVSKREEKCRLEIRLNPQHVQVPQDLLLANWMWLKFDKFVDFKPYVG